MKRNREAVGASFSEEALLVARNRSLEALEAAAQEIKPGMTEDDGRQVVARVLKEFGSTKHWHGPQVRFGTNTTKAFGKRSEPGVILKDDDLFFLDLGPVFDGYEGDVGKTFTVGEPPPKMRQIVLDAKEVFEQTKSYWGGGAITGAALYEFAQAAAGEKGWQLDFQGASGHRISDFPHAIHFRGTLIAYDKKPSKNLWVLEIHLKDAETKYGAFYEDILL